MAHMVVEQEKIRIKTQKGNREKEENLEYKNNIFVLFLPKIFSTNNTI
jgi:hypothetical protein